ncbi:MAG TPA: dihydrofolate reductase family protein [Baekduia sp.]|nr:dihydrofolate reductase family protein [Baekduia sp.]
MSTIVLDTSISLDGFVTGPNDGPGNGLGDGGDVLHDWLWHDDAPPDYRDALFARTGAIVASRRVYDITRGWQGSHPVGAPVVVVTHAAPPAEEVPQGDTPFTFVTTGVPDAIAAAAAIAGPDREVYLMSAAQVGRQALAAGLIDELRIHLAPVVLGGGTRLFDDGGVGPVALERLRVVDDPQATHLEYRVLR